MAETRVYLAQALETGARVELPDAAFRHLVQVLRLDVGAGLSAFNGEGGEYEAHLDTVGKRSATLRIGDFKAIERESPLHTTLVQGISKGERMDWTLQKAVELGVSAIAPVLTERCNVALDAQRWRKKQEHWQGVVVSACEQSGRTRLPILHPVRSLRECLGAPAQSSRFVLDPQAERTLAACAPACKALDLLVGPEGGLTADELRLATTAGWTAVRLGPRVLRTETAGVAALALLQGVAGDFR